MGLFSKDIKSMDDLFVHALRDTYYAENQILKSLPDMIDRAANPQLKQGFRAHLNETKNHVKRLEQVFQLEGQSVKSVDCPAIDGILEEADDVIGDVADAQVLDVLARDRLASFQELADEAFRDLLRKHHRPVGLRAALKASAKGDAGAAGAKPRSRQ